MMQTGKNDPPDTVLVMRAARGDVEAFGDLYTRYLDEILRYIYFRVGNRLDAEDLAETVFVKAWEALTAAPDREIANLRAWLYRIAHNQVVDHYRAGQQTGDLDTHQLQDASPLPEAQSLANADQRRLVASIQQLEASQQQVILCRFINGLSHAETAKVMGLNEGHVRVLQLRALQKLRVLLENE